MVPAPLPMAAISTLAPSGAMLSKQLPAALHKPPPLPVQVDNGRAVIVPLTPVASV